MYQISMSVCKEQVNWFYEIEQVLEIKIRRLEGIMATQVSGGRLTFSIASENSSKATINDTIKECLTDMYCCVVKREYLTKKLSLPTMSRLSHGLLLQTLIAFDRENERMLVSERLNITNNIALDGFFNFLLNDLKQRWDEIVQLATDNASFLKNDDTLNELLKFLISAINPKILRLEVSEQGGKYLVTGIISDSPFEYSVSGAQQLLSYLIDVAPLELSLKGSFSDKCLLQRLLCIFDAKGDNNFLGTLQS